MFGHSACFHTELLLRHSLMTIVSARLAIDPTKVRRAKAALGTRTTRETVNKALDLAIAWEEALGARQPVLSPQKQRRLDT